jgi:hypothetical protein
MESSYPREGKATTTGGEADSGEKGRRGVVVYRVSIVI